MSIVSTNIINTKSAEVTIRIDDLVLHRVNITKSGLYRINYTKNGVNLNYTGGILDIVKTGIASNNGHILIEGNEKIFFYQINYIEDKTYNDAYRIALKYGFEGTEEEWLESLHGKSAYEIAVEHGFEGTEEDWVSHIGGDAMLTWHMITSDEYKNCIPIDGHLYFLTDTKEIYCGTESYTESVIFYSILPTNPILNKLYINSNTMECKIWRGEMLGWKDLMSGNSLDFDGGYTDTDGYVHLTKNGVDINGFTPFLVGSTTNNFGSENAGKLLYVSADGSIEVLSLGTGIEIVDGVLKSNTTSTPSTENLKINAIVDDNGNMTLEVV